jgi:hypothetical protein
MAKTFFEPENLNALAEIFAEAKRQLAERHVTDGAAIDLLAQRILHLAADGLPPSIILLEVAPQGEAKNVLLGQEAAKCRMK